MGRLEILCTTMNQTDLSLVERMKINSDIVLANQCDRNEVIEDTKGPFSIRMISTTTKGVGLNRNISLIHAVDEILLFADDDMQYYDDYENKILEEFDRNEDADVIIFNIDTNSDKRKQKQNKKTKKLGVISALPYGAPRIAIRKKSWEKSNVWFTPLFGGGAKYTSGEDSIFIHDLQAAGLKLYVSKETIGIVNMDSSSWFNGRNSEYYFNKGAYAKDRYRKIYWIWKYYYCLRITSSLSIKDRMKSFDMGVKAYDAGLSFGEVQAEDMR